MLVRVRDGRRLLGSSSADEENQTADGFSWLRDGKAIASLNAKAEKRRSLLDTKKKKNSLLFWLDDCSRSDHFYIALFFRLLPAVLSFGFLFRPPLYRPLCCVSSEYWQLVRWLAYRTSCRPSPPRSIHCGLAPLLMCPACCPAFTWSAPFSHPDRQQSPSTDGYIQPRRITYRRKSQTKAVKANGFHVHAVDGQIGLVANPVVSMNVVDEHELTKPVGSSASKIW